MGRYFNTEGCCYPDEHYMVNLDSRLKEIKSMVDAGKYFTINRGRQYGKTTVLKELEKYLSSDYLVVSLDFQFQMSESKFKNEHVFSAAFARAFRNMLYQLEISDLLKQRVKKMTENMDDSFELVELFCDLSEICKISEKPIVLVIDEVDQASNNQVFLDFLAQLRGYYLRRSNCAAFHSVILAGVHDIRNLRQKIRPDAEHKHNSPWNISADFNVDI